MIPVHETLRPAAEAVQLSNFIAHIVGTTKGDHFSYVIYVETETDQWTVYRRYSEFRELRNVLLGLLSGKKPCSGGCQVLKRLKAVHFPRKHLFHANHHSNVINHRIAKLNVFLSTMVLTLKKCSRHLLEKCEKRDCQVSQLIKDFLLIPGHSTEAAATSSSASSSSGSRKKTSNQDRPDQSPLPPYVSTKTRVGKMFPPSTLLMRSFSSSPEQPAVSSYSDVRLLYTILEEQEMHHPHVA